ncbi:MAG: zinc-ribbon domain-containing protein [Candidatus Freyarchaeum deiterrae]
MSGRNISKKGWCSYCGTQVPSGAVFCPHCGKPIDPNYVYDESISSEEAFFEKGKETIIELRVEEAQKRDAGRFIVRVDNAAMEKLGVQKDDVVEIKGEKATSAIAWPAYPEDKDKGLVRMDEYLRHNANVSLGDKVVIKKASEKQAESVILAPVSVRFPVEERFERFVKRKLVGYPVTQGDVVRIRVLSRVILFGVVKTTPEGIVIVKPQTTLHISEKPMWQKTGGAK